MDGGISRKAEYIDRDELYSALFAMNGKNGNGWDMVEVLELVENFPFADVAPVVHAHWIHDESGWEWDNYYQCSACKNEFMFNEGTPAENDAAYCPYCGAKMDEAILE